VTDTRPLLVFFTSERSGPARRMESLLAHLARKERRRLRITRIDIDKQPDLAERFKVESIPTLVLVKRSPHRGDARTASRAGARCVGPPRRRHRLKSDPSGA
jgi:thioredoxin